MAVIYLKSERNLPNEISEGTRKALITHINTLKARHPREVKACTFVQESNKYYVNIKFESNIKEQKIEHICKNSIFCKRNEFTLQGFQSHNQIKQKLSYNTEQLNVKYKCNISELNKTTTIRQKEPKKAEADYIMGDGKQRKEKTLQNNNKKSNAKEEIKNRLTENKNDITKQKEKSIW